MENENKLEELLLLLPKKVLIIIIKSIYKEFPIIRNQINNIFKEIIKEVKK